MNQKDEELEVYRSREHSVSTGRYIRTQASTPQGAWVLSKNSVDGTVHLNFLGEKVCGLQGMNEYDVEAIRKVCELFINEERQSFKSK